MPVGRHARNAVPPCDPGSPDTQPHPHPQHRLEIRASQVYSSLVDALDRCGRELRAREEEQAAAAATTGTTAAAKGGHACSSRGGDGGGSPAADAVAAVDGAFGVQGMLAGSEAAGSGAGAAPAGGSGEPHRVPPPPWHHGICELVIYGLGSPEHSKNSRYQLALALLLVELLPGLEGLPQVCGWWVVGLAQSRLPSATAQAHRHPGGATGPSPSPHAPLPARRSTPALRTQTWHCWCAWG
jgi:hypothetical protein